MIRYAQGDIFETPADIRVNTVNCVGVMGAGVALAFKNRYPEMFKKYAKACKAGEVRPGKPHVWEKSEFDEIVTVVNLPTKDHWRQPSEYEYVEKGLRWLREFIEKRGEVRVALPALGSGHGGLDWLRVQKMIEAALGDLAAEIIVFEPSSSHAAGERLDESTLARLKELGIKRLQSGDPGYPETLRGRSGATVYLQGNVEALSGPMVAVIPSVKPSEREMQGVLSCVKELANPGVRILTGYSAKADRPIIRTALEQGAHVIICLVEGILLFNIRRDLQDVWDEDRVTVLSAAKPQQKWYPGGVGKAAAIKLSLADAALISDPSPKWLSSFVRNGTDGIRSKIFYLDYGGIQENIKASLRKLQAKPLGRSRESGKPNVGEVLAALPPTETPETPETPQKSWEIKSIAHGHKDCNHVHVPIEKGKGEAFVSYPKRLIEVDLPIKRISAHARREKSIRHGHISTLHIWWARRPLAACRAIVLASLWPDPADPNCPQRFRDEAAKIMQAFRDFRGGKKRDWSNSKDVRDALLDFIADFANWDNSTVECFLDTARNLVHVAHESLGGGQTIRPLVMDPFAGGGAIPLEALRVGADSFASDINPVSMLLNRVLLEHIPEHGKWLPEELDSWGKYIQRLAEKELEEFYPKDSNGNKPIAYIWARIIRCEGPNCGAEVPLLRTLWLCKKENKKVALKLQPKNDEKIIDVKIVYNIAENEIGNGTVARGAATCPLCSHTTSASSVRRQLSERFGGTNDARLIVVVTRSGQRGRLYRLPNSNDLIVIQAAASELGKKQAEHTGEVAFLPEEPTPEGKGKGAGRAFSQRKYGMKKFSDLYTKRQLLALTTFARIIRTINFGETPHDIALRTLFSFAVGRMNDLSMSLCRWLPTIEAVAAANGGQNRMPVVLDFVESNPLGGSGGSWLGQVNWIRQVVQHVACSTQGKGTSLRAAAQETILPDGSVDALITDPPYYDAFPYSDLSDFFLIWLKRCLHRDVFLYNHATAPKNEEIVVYDVVHGDDDRVKDGEFFKNEMEVAFSKARVATKSTGIGVVVFANKTTHGWEALIEGLVKSGWIVTASWPIDTERPNRQRALNSAALGSSVHIVCRPREKSSGTLCVDNVGDWRDVLAELPHRIHEWMSKLTQEGIVGADAIFACLGPALEIFSKYSRVEKASGEEVTLHEYLEQIWAAVAHEALRMLFEGADTSAFEEDARLTAMWLWTLKAAENGSGRNGEEEAVSSGGYLLEYDAARKIAQGLGAHLDGMKDLVEIKGDKARLLPVDERSRHLFGKDDTPKTPRGKKRDSKQLTLFEELDDALASDTAWGKGGAPNPGQTTLDRLHQAMLLFASGRGEALRRFLVDEGTGRDGRFWTLAQALSALYPSNTQEKRWVDGILARKKGMGF